MLVLIYKNNLDHLLIYNEKDVFDGGFLLYRRASSARLLCSDR